MKDWLEFLAGGMVLAITLLDVFLTVLYARAGTGLLAPRLARGVWRVFRALRSAIGAGLLNYCGPVQLVALVLTWAALVAFGAALMIHPGLGTGITSGSGPTDTDFVTALYVGGSSMSIVGASNYAPNSPGYKTLFLFNSLVGLSVTSLTLTYLMQVYSALGSRNATGLSLQTQSGDTGDAAELLARWGPQGRFDGGYSNLSTLAREMTSMKETYHFYPVLYYFRFGDVRYAASRILLVALDVSALLRTAIDADALRWLQESAALAEMEVSSALLLRTLHENFPVEPVRPRSGGGPDERGRLRYEQALARLRKAGIPTCANPEAGAREYVDLRSRWESRIEALADALGFRMEEVDPAGWGGRRCASAADVPVVREESAHR